MSNTQYPSGVISLMYHLVNDENAEKGISEDSPRTEFHSNNISLLSQFGLSENQCNLFMNCGSPGQATSGWILAILSTAIGELQTHYTPTPPSGAVTQSPNSPPYPQGALSLVYNVMYDPSVKERFFSPDASVTQALLRDFGFKDTDINQGIALRSKSLGSPQQPRDPWLWAMMGLILDDLKNPDASGTNKYDRAW